MGLISSFLIGLARGVLRLRYRIRVTGLEVVAARGGRVVLIPFLPGHSTSAIEARIRSGRGIVT